MDKFLVPRLGFVVVTGLATLLIGVIVLRSPDTHANLWETVPSDYTRSPASVVGLQVGDVELMMDEKKLRSGSSAALDPGRVIYLSRGCGMCHGLDALGGRVGPSLAGSVPDIVKHMVRDGPKGMPAYTEAHLSDTDLVVLAGYLQDIKVVKPNSADIAAIQGLTWDPLISPSVLLQGKAALRRSCGACHSQPTKEEIRSAFPSDYDATSLVADMAYETNLNLEDARAIAYYMMAILNGADPLKEP